MNKLQSIEFLDRMKKLLESGLSDQQIADRLGKTHAAIAYHRRKIGFERTKGDL